MKYSKRGYVPFSLANSPKKYSGYSNRLNYKTNIHNLIYVNAKFKNVKFQASNVTECNFRDATFHGIDFMNTNLKKCNFKNCYFEDVIFYSVNLTGANFLNATFKNVYFINTNIQKTKNIDTTCVEILNDNSEIDISRNLLKVIEELTSIVKFKKNYVLTTKRSKGKKVNSLILELLLRDFTQLELKRAFHKLINSDNKNRNKFFITYFSYKDFLYKYDKR